ncbi:hypothetical protein BJ742DRAFT_678981 [Cladochytrium replicatum]|nr:hypothetical protein BJ742DRAFT_678981 [Cladochytrium replicatum]
MPGDPCPHSIVSGIGFGFVLGTVCGVFQHSYKAFLNSPRDMALASMIRSVKLHTPITAARFAVWSGTMDGSHCLMGPQSQWGSVVEGLALGALLIMDRASLRTIGVVVVGTVVMDMVKRRMDLIVLEPQAPEGSWPPMSETYANMLTGDSGWREPIATLIASNEQLNEPQPDRKYGFFAQKYSK